MATTTLASPAIVLRDLPPPTEQPSYIDAWKSRYDRSQVVFGLDWHKNFLAGCTSGGHILVWILKNDTEREDLSFDHDLLNPLKRQRKERRHPDLK